MRRVMIVVLAAGALALAACGGDDDDDAGGDGGEVSAEEQPYVDAIAAQLQTDGDSGLQLTSEQADCVAPRWVDTIGLDRFEEQGITPEDIADDTEDELADLGLDESEGNALYDAFEACDVDVPALLVQSIATDSDLDADMQECLEGALDADLVRNLMVAVVTQGDDALASDSELGQSLTSALAECAPDGY